MKKSTQFAKAGEVERKWVLIDAEGATLGRLATTAAMILRGKNKPQYTPNADTGDFVVVINADKVVLTGVKADHKQYWRYSGYLGGLKLESFREAMEKHPERVVEHAIKGMLPKTTLGRKQGTKLKVYAGPEHPHTAQNPVKIDWRAYPMAENTVVYTGTGRRKEAVARVRLVPGTGKVVVNGREAIQYFGRQQLVDNALAPLRLTETAERFDVLANLDGGGINGQSGALRLGIARALLDAGEYREDLKKAGFLTRDARAVERKKYGLKKARKRPQFSKR